ncbi:tetratricopeptide repeat protein [Pendulispora albinea]|uniref:Tetratricopeptide repeat protein n=1 Tax=Pendulispora albinea TaxID=2741071 RepID=A0ABZ2LPQ7_9BACT
MVLASTPAVAFAQRKGTRVPTPPRAGATPPASTGAASGSSGAAGTSGTAGNTGTTGNDSTAQVPDPETAAKAQQHFQHARELYQQGSYTEAIGELEAAHKLDPAAKDLVYNLIVVNEKLGRIDAALEHMQTYKSMNLDTAERARAETVTRRLEGAKRELEAQRPKPPPPEKQIVERRVTVTKKVEYGRIDALTITSAAVAVAGIGVGTFFGLKAMNDRPSKDFTTGRDGTYDDLTRRADDAHKQAIFADIGFAVGAVGAVATLVLYFARTKTPKDSEITVSGGTTSFRLSF